jgi:AcrR family transcriptional regulator
MASVRASSRASISVRSTAAPIGPAGVPVQGIQRRRTPTKAQRAVATASFAKATSTVPTAKSSNGAVPQGAVPGLRERKKARLRQQIISTAIKLFRKRGYEKTRVDDIVEQLEISQPTFFRYFPSKDAVLREVGRRGYACMAEHIQTELSSKATTAECLQRLYEGLAQETEADRPWLAARNSPERAEARGDYALLSRGSSRRIHGSALPQRGSPMGGRSARPAQADRARSKRGHIFPARRPALIS